VVANELSEQVKTKEHDDAQSVDVARVLNPARSAIVAKGTPSTTAAGEGKRLAAAVESLIYNSDYNGFATAITTIFSRFYNV
jgi:hypothetical protein